MSTGSVPTGSSVARRILRFGTFEFDPETGELRKHGLRVKLRGQPIDVLALLLNHPGEVVTREEVQKRLWPADTYVDFEQSLNAAIKRLRAALGDSADSPRFIETLAGRGYRFIAPISQPADPQPAEPQATAEPPGHPPAPKNQAGGRRRVASWVTAAGVCVLLTVIGIRIFTLREASRARTASNPIRSLAVLPLASLSGDPDQDYFVDGMTDALGQRLEGVSALRVISRTSSMRYRGSTKTAPEIARELNVDAVIEGSVLRAGDRVRITVQMIEAAADRRLWGNSFDGDLKDVLALQAEIAEKIADQIRITLTPPDRARLARVHTTNPEAYLAYSKGRFFWNKRTAEDLKKAVLHLQRAIEKDPGYARAYDALADCWISLGWYGYMAPAETFPQAKAAVIKGLSLDDSLAEAHASMAMIDLYSERDWEGAGREFRRAIDLNPNYANGHHWYGEFLSLTGRHEQAIAESERARELDPLSNIINTWVGSRYFFARQYDKAIEQFRNAVEMDSSFVPVHLVLGQAYEQKGMAQEAIAELERAVSLSGGSSVYLASLAHAYGVAGRRNQALKLLVDLKRLSRQEYVSSYDMAVASIGLGETAQALDLLEKAVEEGSPRVAFLGVEPRFDGLHLDRRFQKLMVRIGPARKTG